MNELVRVLVMDVDGTLTDGMIHISESGELFKSFDVKDGYAIGNMLPAHGITPVIITGRQSEIVKRRAEELKICHLYQGVKDKGVCLQTIAEELHVSLDQIACIGDDLNDLSMMNICGVTGCPADAVEGIKKGCDYICQAPGGHGAVREFVEWLVAPKE